MVTKERLQELINQKATIYEVKYGKVNPVSLKNKIRFVSEKYPVIVFEPRPNEKYKHHKYFDKLYETQSEAEWVAKMHAERTQYFQPPTYEEWLETKYGWTEYNTKFTIYQQEGRIIGGTDARVQRPNTGYEYISCSCNVYLFGITKDNYIKACECARNLFLGKENTNE